MSKSKYDTNPLDLDVKKIADEQMGADEPEGDPNEAPTAVMEDPSGNASSRATATVPPVSSMPPQRTVMQGSIPTAYQPNPMTGADFSPPLATGPAYVPPAPASRGPRTPPPANPTTAARVGYTPGSVSYQAPLATPPAQTPYQPYVHRGLGLDPNIAAALTYIPWIGWIMGVLVLVKEPKTNIFARYHALQSLLLHAGLVVLNSLFGGVVGVGFEIGRWIGVPLGALHSLIQFAAVIGMLFLGITAFQLKLYKVPGVTELIEKYIYRNFPDLS